MPVVEHLFPYSPLPAGARHGRPPLSPSSLAMEPRGERSFRRDVVAILCSYLFPGGGTGTPCLLAGRSPPIRALGETLDMALMQVRLWSMVRVPLLLMFVSGAVVCASMRRV